MRIRRGARFKAVTGLERAVGLLGIGAIVVAGIGVVIGIAVDPDGSYFSWSAWAGFILALIAFGVMMEVAKRRGHAYVRGHDYLVCPHCLYVARGLADGSLCPECGFPITHEEMRRHWQDHYIGQAGEPD